LFREEIERSRKDSKYLKNPKLRKRRQRKKEIIILYSLDLGFMDVNTVIIRRYKREDKERTTRYRQKC